MENHEHEPGNGRRYLQQYGLAHDNVTSLNLFLDGVHLGPEGALQVARGLTENWSLTHLELRRTEVTSQGAVPVAQALVANSTLSYLGLGRNKLCNAGGLHVAEALKHNQTLRSIDLEWNDLRDECGSAIAAMLEVNNSLTELSLERNKIQRDGMAAIGAALGRNAKLKSLNLGWNRAKVVGAIAIADGLRKNGCLLSLNVAMNQIGQEGAFAIANALSENYTLLSLNLQHNRIGDSVVMLGEALKDNHTLRELNMENCLLTPELGVLFGKALSENKSLMSLNISRNDIQDAGVVAVAHAFKSKHSIRFLDLSETGTTQNAMPAVADLLDSCVNLQTLLLEENKIGSEGGRILATRLRTLCPLTSLNLSRTRLEAKGVKAIAEAVKASPVKYMRNMQLADNEGGSEAILLLCKALIHGSSLVSLDLSNNDVTDAVREALSQVLVANPNLSYIFLKGNPVAVDLGNTALYRDEAQPYLSGVLGMQWSPPKSGDEESTLPPVADPSQRDDPYVPSANFASSNLASGSATKNAKVAADIQQAVGDSSVAPTRGDGVFLPGNGCVIDPNDVNHIHSLEALERFAAETDKVVAKSAAAAAAAAEQRPAASTGVRAAKATHTPVNIVSQLKTARLVKRPHTFQSHRLEGNISELLLTDDQLRKEFNKLDRDGNGYLNSDEFKSVYASFNNFGVVPSDRELQGILTRHNTRGDNKITYNEYCVIMLGLARR